MYLWLEAALNIFKQQKYTKQLQVKTLLAKQPVF